MELLTRRKIVPLLLCTFSFLLWANPADCKKELSDSVVKIFVTSNSMDFAKPWQSKGISMLGGSGSIIKDNQILTNAHVVSDHTFIQVKKHNDSKKYTARVVAISHDSDLALLTVDDPYFFKGTEPLSLGELPYLQDSVIVIGYPTGGDKLSITEGVVSRVEVITYSQSGKNLLGVQIDAAINPGNSGGPVLKDGKIVGVAMQNLRSGQNIGYMIPIPVVKHFFDDLKDGHYDGFPLMGLEYNNTENKSLRKYYAIEDQEGGVIVSHILPRSPAYNILEEEDVILAVDGIVIGEDGTFSFRENERLSLPHLITSKQIGETVDLKVMRKGEEKEITLTLNDYNSLVPYPHQFDTPTYYIYGGLVFTILSADFLQSWGDQWWEKSPLDLTYYLAGVGRLNLDHNDELVVLIGVLPDDINAGYHTLRNAIIKNVDGQKFKSFKEFIRNIQESKKNKDYTLIEAENNTKIIIENADVDQIDEKIMKRNSIPRQYSEDVAAWITP